MCLIFVKFQSIRHYFPVLSIPCGIIFIKYSLFWIWIFNHSILQKMNISGFFQQNRAKKEEAFCLFPFRYALLRRSAPSGPQPISSTAALQLQPMRCPRSECSCQWRAPGKLRKCGCPSPALRHSPRS